MNNKILELIFKISLFITLLLSFYMFTVSFIYKNVKFFNSFSTWQFPMLLALFLDVYVIEI